MVTFKPTQKYELVDAIRIHNGYTPATAPVSTTLSVISVGDENTELTLTTALVGTPAQDPDEITSADPSPVTSTNPTPLIAIV